MSSAILDAFESARKDFLSNFKASVDYDFSQFTSIVQVYEATDEIQKRQGQTGSLRNLRKIQPYLDGLRHYSSVLETFVQVKPEILALIWGPIKFLLQVSSTYVKSFDKVLEVLAEIGYTLPLFLSYEKLLKSNDRVHHVLVIFYKDILDFHSTVLSFFKAKGWRVFFESLWPRYAEKITMILENISKHKLLLDSEVTLANITDAYTARSRIYEEHERNQASWQRQHFDSMKLSLSPYLYDHDLERVLDRQTRDTGQWLWAEEDFCDWLNPRNTSGRTLWLVGIPGAAKGKTFLASAVIKKARQTSCSIVFALLSYQTSEATTKLKILHSFLFQLLYDHKHLQPMMRYAYENQYRRLSSTASYVQEILCEVVKCIGTVFVVVDGLDEMSESERQSILKTLLELSGDCADLRLMISSRAEPDISRLLKPQCQIIEVDRKNLNDIKRYVVSAATDWLPTLNISPLVTAEIRALLLPIASKAEGMFLYARLVMQNLFSQNNLDDIKKEAGNLPDGLDEAYGRIVSRIKQSLGAQERLDAIRTLEWIGCSKVPIRKTELEHALIIREGDRGLVLGRKSVKDIFQLCGPIIELQDEYVVFVHFTVQEYLFGKQSQHLLAEIKAHRSVATLCMSYLMFDYFDVNIDHPKIQSSILAGGYVLQGYAMSQWLFHIIRGAKGLTRDDVSSNKFCNLIFQFLKKLRNPKFEEPSEAFTVATYGLQPFRKDWPYLYDSLSQVYRFTVMRHTGISLADGETWTNHDPLLLSISSLRIRDKLERILCSSNVHSYNCHCDILQGFYGTRFFKCNKPACEYAQIGFERCVERDMHLNVHERPFKCLSGDCEFAEIGFASKDALEKHCQELHGNQSTEASITASFEITNSSDLESILFDTVEIDELNNMCRLLSKLPTPPSLEMYRKLMRRAVLSSSTNIVNFLLGKVGDINQMDPPILYAAAERSNIEIVTLLLNHGADVHAQYRAVGKVYSRFVLDAAILQGYPLNLEMVQVLLNHGANATEILMSPAALIESNASPSEELQNLKIFLLLSQQKPSKWGPEDLNKMLKKIPERGCSCNMTRLLVEQGADINHHNPSNPVFIKAARKKGRRGARLMKFLLLSGADPRLKSVNGELAGSQLGAKNISKWFGITWNELIQETRKARENGQADTEMNNILQAERTENDGPKVEEVEELNSV